MAWLIHQYRAAYELCGTPYSDFGHTEQDVGLRDTLIRLDTEMLGECRAIFANARNTAARLAKFNGLSATALYHPPRLAPRLTAGPYGDYVLSVGRIESVKRVDLIVRALATNQRGAALDRRRRRHAARERRARGALARCVGSRDVPRSSVQDDALIELYAGALAVIYPPYDEDFGYVTLESFLARKPVVTCTDSGGPNEFVVDGTNGYVCEPAPQALADAIERLSDNRSRAAALGDAGHAVAAADYLGWRHRGAGGLIAKTCRIAIIARFPGHRRPSGLLLNKLIIQIPCLNEAETLPATLAELPRSIPGIDIIEVLVVDDGSRDGTADVARAAGVDHVVRLRRNKGLAAAFAAGIDASLKRGADFIVNTDADNQYPGGQIPALLEPLLKGEADIVIGDRNIAEVRHMSWRKRQLQRLGSWVVRQVSSTSVPDTTSGFRAYTRDAALRMTIVSEFSYTLESIIQAGKKRMAIAHVPIETNPRTRKSRLFDSVFSYIKRSAATIVRIYAMYEPLKIFTYVGVAVIFVGVLISSRFFYTFLTEPVSWARHLQSLLFAGVFLIVGVQVLLIGLLADVISANRKLLEDLLYRVRSLELPDGDDADDADAGVSSPRELSRTGVGRRWDR